MKTMTLEVAEKVHAAFGSGTSVCECMSAQELLDDFNEGNFANDQPWESVNVYIKVLLDAEDVDRERAIPNEPTTACLQEHERFRREYHGRVEALMRTLHCPAPLENAMKINTEALLPSAPIYYHPLNFPVNCYDPDSLRVFANMLAHALRPEDGSMPIRYPVKENGRIALTMPEVDIKAHCVAMVIPDKGSLIFETWPIVPAAMFFGYVEETPEYESLAGQYVVYMTITLSDCILNELKPKHREEA